MPLTTQQREKLYSLEDGFLSRQKKVLESAFDSKVKDSYLSDTEKFYLEGMRRGRVFDLADWDIFEKFAKAGKNVNTEINKIGASIVNQSGWKKQAEVDREYVNYSKQRSEINKNFCSQLEDIAEARIKIAFLDDLKTNYRQREKEIGIGTFSDERELFKAMDMMRELYNEQIKIAKQKAGLCLTQMEDYPASFQRDPGPVQVRCRSYQNAAEPYNMFKKNAEEFRDFYSKTGNIDSYEKHSEYCAKLYDENFALLAVKELTTDRSERYDQFDHVFIDGKPLSQIAKEGNVTDDRDTWIKNRLAEAMIEQAHNKEAPKVTVEWTKDKPEPVNCIMDEFSITPKEPGFMSRTADWLAYFADFGLAAFNKVISVFIKEPVSEVQLRGGGDAPPDELSEYSSGSAEPEKEIKKPKTL